MLDKINSEPGSKVVKETRFKPTLQSGITDIGGMRGPGRAIPRLSPGIGCSPTPKREPVSEINLLRCLLLLFTSVLMMSCGLTWRIQELPDAQATGLTRDRVAIIESQPGRKSPGIKTFKHFELGIELESAGHRHNDAYARTRVETPPGDVEIGVVFPHNIRTYYPVVEFTAEPGQRYFLTWICVPYPFAAITDADSSKVLAMDTFCPDCDGMIGKPVTSNSECLRHTQPPWMEPDEKAHWLPWALEYRAQIIRNLCYAADRGITGARMRLAELSDFGTYRNPVQAYLWYRLVALSDDHRAEEAQGRLERLQLTPIQLQQAKELFDTWEQGKCSAHWLGEISRKKYEIRFPD